MLFGGRQPRAMPISRASRARRCLTRCRASCGAPRGLGASSSWRPCAASWPAPAMSLSVASCAA
eukprot:5494922-Lingulodinium_polyedra.AAC.1